MFKRIIIIITALTSATLAFIGCGRCEEGKIYFQAARHPYVKGDAYSRWGIAVHSNGRIKDLYKEYGSPTVTKDGKKMIAGP